MVSIITTKNKWRKTKNISNKVKKIRKYKYEIKTDKKERKNK